MRAWAFACSISALACFNSDCFSWIVRCSVVPSNCTTTSPALDLGAVGRELEDLKFARLHRRGQHDRFGAAGSRRAIRSHRRTRRGSRQRSADRAPDPRPTVANAAADEDDGAECQQAVAAAEARNPGRAHCVPSLPRALAAGGIDVPRQRSRLREAGGHDHIESARCANRHRLFLVRAAVLHADKRLLAVAADGVARNDQGAGDRASVTSRDAVRSGMRFGCEPLTAIKHDEDACFGRKSRHDSERRDLRDTAVEGQLRDRRRGPSSRTVRPRDR